MVGSSFTTRSIALRPAGGDVRLPAVEQQRVLQLHAQPVVVDDRLHLAPTSPCCCDHLVDLLLQRVQRRRRRGADMRRGHQLEPAQVHLRHRQRQDQERQQEAHHVDVGEQPRGVVLLGVGEQIGRLARRAGRARRSDVCGPAAGCESATLTQPPPTGAAAVARTGRAGAGRRATAPRRCWSGPARAGAPTPTGSARSSRSAWRTATRSRTPG